MTVVMVYFLTENPRVFALLRPCPLPPVGGRSGVQGASVGSLGEVEDYIRLPCTSNYVSLVWVENGGVPDRYSPPFLVCDPGDYLELVRGKAPSINHNTTSNAYYDVDFVGVYGHERPPCVKRDFV